MKGKKKTCACLCTFSFGLRIPFLAEEEEWQRRLEKNGP
jgi:hypothetical protein